MIFEGKFTIGKKGLTQGVIESLNLALKTHTQIRISTLKSATRNKEKLIQIAEEIISKLNYKSNYRIIGFTILLRKQTNKKLVNISKV
jgi:RNA-binding protein YhbY